MSETNKYYVLKWNKVIQTGFPVFEVRPMPVEPSSDYTIVAEDIPFAIANKRRKFLEKKK